MNGWYEFIYRGNDGLFFRPSFIDRDKDGLPDIIESMIAKQSDTKIAEGWKSFRPELPRWYTFPSVLEKDEMISLIDPMPRRDTIYTIHHDPLKMEICPPNRKYDPQATYKITDDLILEVDTRAIPFLRMCLDRLDEDSAGYHPMNLNSGRTMIPNEIIDLLKGSELYQE